MKKVKPCLWFNYNADEALEYYQKVFKNFEITNVTKYGPNQGGPEGATLTADFRIEDEEFMALNGGPHFQFNEAVSLMVFCEDQQEVDRYWKMLTDGGMESQCGWLKDKFGLSWQIVPKRYVEMVNEKNPEKFNKMMAAMMKMIKLDIAELERAYNS